MLGRTDTQLGRGETIADTARVLSRYVDAIMIVRDVMLPAIWSRGWLGGAVEWRGNAMTIRTKAMTELEEASSGA